jgi:hypothetical protein
MNYVDIPKELIEWIGESRFRWWAGTLMLTGALCWSLTGKIDEMYRRFSTPSQRKRISEKLRDLFAVTLSLPLPQVFQNAIARIDNSFWSMKPGESRCLMQLVALGLALTFVSLLLLIAQNYKWNLDFPHNIYASAVLYLVATVTWIRLLHLSYTHRLSAKLVLVYIVTFIFLGNMLSVVNVPLALRYVTEVVAGVSVFCFTFRTHFGSLYLPGFFGP